MYAHATAPHTPQPHTHAHSTAPHLAQPHTRTHTALQHALTSDLPLDPAYLTVAGNHTELQRSSPTVDVRLLKNEGVHTWETRRHSLHARLLGCSRPVREVGTNIELRDNIDEGIMRTHMAWLHTRMHTAQPHAHDVAPHMAQPHAHMHMAKPHTRHNRTYPCTRHSPTHVRTRHSPTHSTTSRTQATDNLAKNTSRAGNLARH